MSELTHEDLIQIAKRYNGEFVNEDLKRPLTEEEIEAVVWWAEILNRDDEKYINSFIRSMIIVGNIPNILNDYRQKDVAKEELIKFKVEVMRKLRYRIRWGGVSENIKIKKDEYQK